MKNTKIKSLIVIMITICLFSTGCTEFVSNETNQNTSEGKLVVHYLDVGQGDSILIQFPENRVALIDGGTRESGQKVVNYIKNLGIEKIDYLIATHPHEDHIGGLPEVVRNFEIGKVYMPNKTANTKIFETLLTEIDNKGLKITIAKGFDTIIDEGNLKFSILAPLKDEYPETNDYSIVTKLEYLDNSFLFTGDIEKEAEMDLIEAGYDLKSDVLKVAHHGSNSSSSEEFLKAVDPDYSVISLGKDNSYGHPHKETLDRLNSMGIEILRTDELGDIVVKSDGVSLTVKGVAFNETNRQTDNTIYIGNKNTKVFHSKGCKSLPKEENQVIFNSYEQAIEADFTPHSQCIK